MWISMEIFGEDYVIMSVCYKYLWRDEVKSRQLWNEMEVNKSQEKKKISRRQL